MKWHIKESHLSWYISLAYSVHQVKVVLVLETLGGMATSCAPCRLSSVIVLWAERTITCLSNILPRQTTSPCLEHCEFFGSGGHETLGELPYLSNSHKFEQETSIYMLYGIQPKSSPACGLACNIKLNAEKFSNTVTHIKHPRAPCKQVITHRRVTVVDLNSRLGSHKQGYNRQTLIPRR